MAAAAESQVGKTRPCLRGRRTGDLDIVNSQAVIDWLFVCQLIFLLLVVLLTSGCNFLGVGPRNHAIPNEDIRSC